MQAQNTVSLQETCYLQRHPQVLNPDFVNRVYFLLGSKMPITQKLNSVTALKSINSQEKDLVATL